MGNNAKPINLPLLVGNTERYYFLLLNISISNLNDADAFTSTKASLFLHKNSFNWRVKIVFLPIY